MTSLYPRLQLRAAAERLDELRTVHAAGGSVEQFVALRHPQAVWAPTGGSVCSEGELEDVRSAVLGAVGDIALTAGIARARQAAVDLAIGRALSATMDINHSDAGHQAVWAFVTLVVLPDVAVARFPDLHEDRMLGGPRNTFRRLWMRDLVVGDLMEGVANPLGEDEMVGIFERSELARNRHLSRAMARTVLANQSPNRSAFARSLYKRVRFHTGAYALDLHTEDELFELCQRFASELEA
ncbi:hypothetical protein N5P18_00315 [Janibacter terrae]|uniref:Uncharacterized protein n=1 Tax=Janibacter terrae TaxID=103817 RepID=A0ABZ2FDF5_9MICO